MKMPVISWRTGLTLTAFLCISSSGFSQQENRTLQQVLEHKLKKEVLSLRVPDCGTRIHFDINGTALNPQHGVVSLDRDLVVKKVKFSGGQMKIEGQRVYYMWNSKRERLEGSMGEPKVEVDIDLPQGNLSEGDVSPFFKKVFESSQGLESSKCPAREIDNSKPYLVVSERKPVDSVPSLKSDLVPLCLPTGARGYQVGHGVTPPKPIYTPDPEYSESARHSKVQGTAIYAVALDQNGLVSDVLLVRSLEPTLNYKGAVAVRDWRFQPAVFQGQPVPVVINVEVNFRLY